MKFLKSISILILLSFVFLSCKKDSTSNDDGQSSNTALPNFGNINLGSVFSSKDDQLKNQDSIVSVIKKYYENVWEKGDLWGGFLVAKGDKILYENYRGFGQDQNEEPITATVPLHVASVSKPITAMATLKLVEGGRIGLYDHVTKFFPKFPYPKVTVYSLLTQRSGLPKYEYFIEKIAPKPAELSKKFITNQDVLQLLIRYKPELSRDTDTGFEYCNTNFALLALIIEKVTAIPFPEAMQQIVFRPLKMKNTHIFEEKDTLTAAKSFYQRGPKVYPYDRLDLIYGDKNVYTTPRDLLNFSKAMYAKNFLRHDLYDLVFQPHSNERPGVNNYGIGFRMKVFDANEKLTYHNGWWHGTNSVFGHLLKSKVTIVAIGNKYSRRVYSALALSGLFENFPYEMQKFRKEMNENDSLQKANPQGNPDSYSE